MKTRDWYRGKVYALFKDEYGRPYLMTDGQCDIFRLVYEQSILRAAIRATTQYGKSDVTSMALISLLTDRRDKALIVAPSGEQAGIIMRYLIGHLFDNVLITNILALDTSIERLKRERSKQRITFKNDSEIFTLTADAETVSKESRNLMGFGASIVIEDESSLIPDPMHSKILRMVGGKVFEGTDTGKFIKLGNPFFRNHFQKAFDNPRYEKIIIRKEQAIAEGRLTQKFIEEAKADMTPMDFTIFYDCDFPPEGAENSLIRYDFIQMGIDNKKVATGTRKAGLDIARFGRDKSVYIYRDGGQVKRIETLEHADTMKVVGWVIGQLKQDGNPPLNLDVVGLGAGVYDRLVELEKYEVYGINGGEAGTSDEAKRKFHNLRAEMYWNLKDQFNVVNGQSLINIPNDTDLIRDLQEIRYDYSSERRIKIEGKEEIKKRLGRSPDKADALALAFFNYEVTEPELVIE